MKILVADDDARMRQLVRQIVGGLASEVYEAGDGGEAIVICAARRPDWVLMDLRMKPMDGLHATAEITARFPRTQVAIVSQYADAELRAEAARVGACAYVLKENLHELPGILTGAALDRQAAKSNADQSCPSNALPPANLKENGARVNSCSNQKLNNRI